MTDQPNIQREVLEYVIEERQRDGVVAVNLREFAVMRSYDEQRVANTVLKLGDAVDWGVSPMHPWPAEEDVAREHFEAWDAPLPEGFESAGWY